MSSLHQHAKDVFLAALARPNQERDAFVAEACGTDLALKKEVESLLAFYSEGADSGDDASGSRRKHTTDAPTLPFAPGEVFAGRYRMITRIGRGGMGDVWRADDLVLQTPVALKLIHLSGPEARERILNEVRLARQVTHPAVCRVFDVGEANGQVFFSMELVQGEDLATLLRRVGHLPSERVLDIARQLTAGLAAAHAQGVLHRDLKPANVLIDDRGRVLITDFGIAVPQTGKLRHTVIGTPGYMAPEQLTQDAPLTERTDLYALGVVLYELLVGEHPFDRQMPTTSAVKPSARVPHVDRRLERVVMQALSPDPRKRPISAHAMEEFLLGATLPPTERRRWIGLAVAAAVLAAAIALTVPFLMRSRPVPLTEQDTIVLADFANTTGEQVFDGALKVALAVALEQSPFLRVFSDDRVQETLGLMGRPRDEPITRAIAREIARREQLKALLAGSIARLGRNYVIALEVVNAESGDTMARQQIEVSSQEEVLSALGTAVAGMRETLGESLASVQRFDAPLARATTSSLEALHAYSLALDHGSVNPRLEAIPHLRRAIELDPNFALALAFMATVYSNNGQTALASDFARRAFELRDRVSERERFFIAFRYYRDATQDWEKALDLARSWTATYPREAFAFNSLGTAYMRFGQNDAAIEPFRTAMRLDRSFQPPYANLTTTLIALNRYDEAAQVIEYARAQNIEFSSARRHSYTLAFIAGDAAKMREALEPALEARDATAMGWQAHTSAFAGQVAAAHDRFQRGIQMAIQQGLREVAAQMSAEDAEVHAIVGQCDDTRRELAEAVALSRDNYTLERGSRAIAFCGDEGETTALSRELSRQFPESVLTMRVALPMTTAALAVAQTAPARALSALESVRSYESAQRAELWPAYLRGVAHLQLKAGADAATEFQSVIDRRGEDPESQLYPLAHLGLARANVLVGDVAGARTLYARFLELWRDADPTLPAVAAARQEQQRCCL